MTPKERIIATAFIIFLGAILLFMYKAADQKRKQVSEAVFTRHYGGPSITPKAVPFCRDGTPAGSCCKSGHLCAEVGSAYLCIGTTCK